MICIKLTEAQSRVMEYMGHGWPAFPTHGSAISINGKRTCNTDTMYALKRVGFVFQDGPAWKTTEAGKRFTIDGMPRPTRLKRKRRRHGCNWVITRNDQCVAADSTGNVWLFSTRSDAEQHYANNDVPRWVSENEAKGEVL